MDNIYSHIAKDIHFDVVDSVNLKRATSSVSVVMFAQYVILSYRIVTNLHM
jgi:hypothetical protein